MDCWLFESSEGNNIEAALILCHSYLLIKTEVIRLIKEEYIIIILGYFSYFSIKKNYVVGTQ